MSAGTKVSIKYDPERRSFEAIKDKPERRSFEAFNPEYDELWSLKKVREVTGFGTSNVYRLMDDRKFPQPIRVGDRSVRWLKSEVVEYINERLAERV